MDNMKKGMTLDEAKAAFQKLLSCLPSELDAHELVDWINAEQQPKKTAQEKTLSSIASYLRKQVPFDAVLESEKFIVPTHGRLSDCSDDTTIHVDAFLYDGEAMEDLFDEGKLKSSYCKDCGSREIASLTILSHSASHNQLVYIFKHLLPDLSGQVVVDVGSRLGAVLYGAHVYTNAKKIIGIELNSEFCGVQKSVVKKFGLANISVVEGDVCSHGAVIADADVIILHNVFDFFLEREEQKEAWLFIKKWAKKNALLVTVPALQESLASLCTDVVVENWVEMLEPHNTKIKFCEKYADEINDIFLYRVL